jgi:uncharacterized ferritin-like protein (DUF455 family)
MGLSMTFPGDLDVSALVATSHDGDVDAQRLLQVALANEINVSELAARWMPTTRELDVKLAFARQAGDEAGHFQLVAERLTALGFDVAAFAPPAENALFAYLRGLDSTIERIAAGLYALEAVAYAVNESFMAYCAKRGDVETVRIYREYIQPDERAHHELGKRLLAKYARTADEQALAHATAANVLELAAATRSKAATALGVACFPGC